MLGSLSPRFFSLILLTLLSGSIVINGKIAFWADPSPASTPTSLPASTPAPANSLQIRSPEAVTQPVVLLSPNSDLNDRSVTCNSYPNRQCLTP